MHGFLARIKNIRWVLVVSFLNKAAVLSLRRNRRGPAWLSFSCLFGDGDWIVSYRYFAMPQK
jgi:hypothetical protein